ncbi:MAG: alanine--tRNA ligase [Thermodesulfovibrionales bacterium]
MKSSDVRETFLDFFRSKGHEVVRSSSLLPANDPTLLFTNAGMVQFKSVFLGDDARPYSRAATSQKCIRAGGKHNDLENVGHTARHHTFFEMLGNFSFGDYFKSEAIEYAWELLTERYRLPRERLWATVFEEDDEAAGLWTKLTGIPADRVVRLGAKDNFWQMGDTGPCGPCSEIIIDQGSHIGCGRPDCSVGCDCDRFLEIWNLVFMQFDRSADGKLTPLPKPSIDTGMGLERLSAVLQGKYNNFDSDLFAPIISGICSLSRKEYGRDRATDTAIRVIADHIRSITFLLSEGLTPSNEGRGYVLRRIIRRAARYAKSLDIAEPVLYRLCGSVLEAMPAYPELRDEAPRVSTMLKIEEERFNKTLEQGLSVLHAVIGETKKSGNAEIAGSELFRLYDTFGFPLDIARDVAEESGLRIDEPGFHREMEAQKAKARSSWSAETASAAPVYKDLFQKKLTSEFVGYDSMASVATVLAVISNGRVVDQIAEGGQGEVLLDRTPFYAESGGQAGDRGRITGDGLAASVLDTRKPLEQLILSSVRVDRGTIRTGSAVTCVVDEELRRATMRNHTATHLLHSALRNILGEHVKQAGSSVGPDRLRFDFTHFSSIDTATLTAIEDEINAAVLKNVPVSVTEMETKKALDSGVTALFGEKYGDVVRVVTIPDLSAELCGGTHASATGDIGLFKILSEGSVASGIRRIEAVTGKAAIEYCRAEEAELRKVCEALKVTASPSEKLGRLLADMKSLERSLEAFKSKSLSESSSKIVHAAKTVKGVKVLCHSSQGVDAKDLRTLADNIRDHLGSGILLLASSSADQVSLVLMVTKDLLTRFNAGSLLKDITAQHGGRGGGKPDLAQGGIRDASKLDLVFQDLYRAVETK